MNINTLEIKNLHAKTEDGTKILKGISLTIKSGEIHAIMGPNGSGKSTLCKVLMGHPNYEITEGSATFNGKNILDLPTNERAKMGLFLGFQHPLEVQGVTLGNFLRLAKNIQLKAAGEEQIAPREFINAIKSHTAELKMDDSFINRSVNAGFSGGEKKRAEIVQMSMLKPKIALLDEIDSGLDIDALRTVANGINQNFERYKPGILLITHYQRLLNYITPQHIHIMHAGKIIKSGGAELAIELESEGYDKFINN